MMPTEAAPKTNRETWIDWVPDEGREDALLDAEPMLTRDELVAELEQLDIAVTARDLIHWQTVGAIPYPHRRRHKGATRGVYPQWMINTIHQLRSLQEQGYKLREIGPLLRHNTYVTFTPYPKTPRQQRQHDKRMARRAFFPLVDELDPRIRSFARVHERIHGGHVVHAEMSLIDDQGQRHTYLFPTGDTESEPSLMQVDTVR
jgi:DNA-binding transcriptional MerR regulator